MKSVADGDTITILDSTKTQQKIRLYGIDYPEKGQPFGKAAKKHTAKLTACKTANVIPYDTDLRPVSNNCTLVGHNIRTVHQFWGID